MACYVASVNHTMYDRGWLPAHRGREELFIRDGVSDTALRNNVHSASRPVRLRLPWVCVLGKCPRRVAKHSQLPGNGNL